MNTSATTPSNPHSATIPAPAAWLGGAGVLPFLAFLLLAVLGRNAEQRALGLQAFVAYGAVIATFLGGIRWGAALPAPDWRRLSMSVFPSLIAFMLLLVPPRDALYFLAALFPILGVFDLARSANALWPSWFKRLRLRLTIAVFSLHLVLIFTLPE